MFCSKCGAQLPDDITFCSACGYKLKSSEPLSKSENETNSTIETDSTESTNSYKGIVKRCANCNGPITEGTTICPTCGSKITNSSAKSSVRDFREQMFAIEASRPVKRGGFAKSGSGISKTDELKLALIRNYPIPNTFDDILEFFLFACQNINLDLSKQTASKAVSRNIHHIMGARSADVETTISDAWVSKAEECYNKAALSFSDHPDFDKLDKAYTKKLKDLRKKPKNKLVFETSSSKDEKGINSPAPNNMYVTQPSSQVTNNNVSEKAGALIGNFVKGIKNVKDVATSVINEDKEVVPNSTPTSNEYEVQQKKKKRFELYKEEIPDD